MIEPEELRKKVGERIRILLEESDFFKSNLPDAIRKDCPNLKKPPVLGTTNAYVEGRTDQPLWFVEYLAKRFGYRAGWIAYGELPRKAFVIDEKELDDVVAALQQIKDTSTLKGVWTESLKELASFGSWVYNEVRAFAKAEQAKRKFRGNGE